MSSTIKITDTGRHVEIEWPDGSSHRWVSISNNSWHDLVNKIANAVQTTHTPGPASSSAKSKPVEASELQYSIEGLAAYLDLHALEVGFSFGVWFCNDQDGKRIAESTDFTTLIETILRKMS
jgi:hypothetical protein